MGDLQTLSIQVFRYTKSELREKAEDLLAQHSLLSLPVDIEYLVEGVMGLNIVPIPGLHRATGILGYLSTDRTEISVDEATFDKRPHQYRFTLAHELSHLLLHKEVIVQCCDSNLDGWKNGWRQYLQDEAKIEFAHMERQADEMARGLLVPSTLLSQKVTPFVLKATANGMDLRQGGQAAQKFISKMVSNQFGVPSWDIFIRLQDEDLP